MILSSPLLCQIILNTPPELSCQNGSWIMSLFFLKSSKDIELRVKANILIKTYNLLHDLGPHTLQPYLLLVPPCSLTGLLDFIFNNPDLPYFKVYMCSCLRCSYNSLTLYSYSCKSNLTENFP